MQEEVKTRYDEEEGQLYVECWFCGDEYEVEELYHTNIGCLCNRCIEALWSHGEKPMVCDRCKEEDFE